MPAANSWPLIFQLLLGPVLISVPVKPTEAPVVSRAAAHKLSAWFFFLPMKSGTTQFFGAAGGAPDPRERLLRKGMIKADFSGTFLAKAGAKAKSIL